MLRNRLIQNIKYHRNISLSNCKRKFSDKKPNEMNVEEEKSVLSMIPFKYWLVIVPVAVTGICTTVVSKVTPVRDYLYDNFPGTVEFIRKHVDIANEEERMLEISRIKANEKEIQKSVDAIVTYENGHQLTLSDIPGTKSYKEFRENLNENSNGYQIINIEFISKNETESIGNYEDAHSTTSRTSSSTTQASVDHIDANRYTNADLLLKRNASEDSWFSPSLAVQMGGSSKVCINDKTPSMQSLKKVEYSTRNNLNTVLYGSKSNDDDGKDEISLSSVRSVKYNNILSYLLYGLSLYDKQGNLNGYTLRYKNPIPIVKNEAIDIHHSQEDVDSYQLNKSVEKYNALEMIRSIEKDIQYLNLQKLSGSRSIDDVETDITGLKAKKTALERKYVNTFYYF